MLKMVYSTYKKQRILYLYSQGYRPPTIKEMLDKKNLKCSRVGVYKFLKLYSTTLSINRRVGLGRPSKITAEIKQLVEQQMRTDGVSTTPNGNRERIFNFAPHYTEVSNCARMDISRQHVYCQLIPEANKQKRLRWARQHLGQSFEDVIWTDESTIQLESHRRFACRKRGETPRPKPRYMN
jgi:transposase